MAKSTTDSSWAESSAPGSGTSSNHSARASTSRARGVVAPVRGSHSLRTPPRQSSPASAAPRARRISSPTGSGGLIGILPRSLPQISDSARGFGAHLTVGIAVHRFPVRRGGVALPAEVLQRLPAQQRYLRLPGEELLGAFEVFEGRRPSRPGTFGTAAGASGRPPAAARFSSVQFRDGRRTSGVRRRAAPRPLAGVSARLAGSSGSPPSL